MAKSFGQGRENVIGIKQAMADAYISVVGLGGELQDIQKIQTDVASSLGRNIVLASDFLLTGDTSYISSTIIDGNANGSVVKLYNTDATAQLVGIIIKNGDASGGGGIKTSGTNNSKIKNVIIIADKVIYFKNDEKVYTIGNSKAINENNTITAFSLEYDKKKPSATCRKNHLSKLLPEIDKLGITTVLCCDGEYFKSLVGGTQSEAHLGYVLPCKLKGYEHINVVYGFNYQGFFYNPDNRDRMALAYGALKTHLDGTYKMLGADVLQTTYTPTTEAEIAQWLVFSAATRKTPVRFPVAEFFFLRHFVLAKSHRFLHASRYLPTLFSPLRAKL